MNVTASTRATLVPDIQGSIVASLDSSSGALSKRSYLPYGGSASAAGSFAYTGQRIDPETNGLYYYRARHYMPAWGRFMQADPIGYGGGGNLYRYVGNDPLNNTDLNGLAKVEIRYNPIPQTLYIASHSYVVVSESDGSNPVVFRAGPSNNGSFASSGSSNSTSSGSASSGSLGWGTINAQQGVYGPGGLDYTTSPRASIPVINDNLPASYYIQKLQTFESSVNAAAIPYDPLSTNSNAFAAQAIESLGVARPQAPTLAPGAQTNLPVTQGAPQDIGSQFGSSSSPDSSLSGGGVASGK